MPPHTPRFVPATFGTICLLLSCLLLLACTSTPRHDANAPPPARLTILISVDGFPASLLSTGAMPTVDALAHAGVRAEWMNPSYPTLTFPNHYTLVTGWRPDRHGIVHNKMLDDSLGYFDSKEASGKNGRWWGGEPIWATLQKQGGIAATMFWPGSEVEIGGIRPRYYVPFNGGIAPIDRSGQVLRWLDLPVRERPQLITLYFEQYDVAGHHNGARSPQAMAALRDIDAAISALRRGLAERRIEADLIVVSDHGLTDVPREHTIRLQERFDPTRYRIGWWGQLLGVTPMPDKEASIEQQFVKRHDHFECWRKDRLPAHWHYGSNSRIPPIVCQADAGWRLQGPNSEDQYQPVKGEHGFSPDDPSMRAMFVAIGPSLCRAKTLPSFDNIDVYSLLARLQGVQPADNDGSIDALLPALREANPGC